MPTNITSEKYYLRKEYNLIRYSNPYILHQKIKSNVKMSLELLSRKYNVKGKYIGIYWPLKGEIDIRFIKKIKNQKVALPSSSKIDGLNYRYWSRKQLELDSNNIPAPLKENVIKPNDISMLFVPAIAIDKEGYRLGYGGGYFDRLRKEKAWSSIPSFVVISQNCVSKNPLPRDKWDLPFNGWISEIGLQQIESTK